MRRNAQTHLRDANILMLCTQAQEHTNTCAYVASLRLAQLQLSSHVNELASRRRVKPTKRKEPVAAASAVEAGLPKLTANSLREVYLYDFKLSSFVLKCLANCLILFVKIAEQKHLNILGNQHHW